MIVNSDEGLQKFVAELDEAVATGSITPQQRLHSLLSLAEDHADLLLKQTEEVGRILQANAMAEAKARVLEISNRHLFTPFHQEESVTDSGRETYAGFMAALDRGEHIDFMLQNPQ
jgi:hypothetical protein